MDAVDYDVIQMDDNQNHKGKVNGGFIDDHVIDAFETGNDIPDTVYIRSFDHCIYDLYSHMRYHRCILVHIDSGFDLRIRIVRFLQYVG